MTPAPVRARLSKLASFVSSLSSSARRRCSVLSGHAEWRVRRSNKKVVIFDKDGTLIDVHSQWVPWIRQLVSSIEAETRLNISAKAFSELAFDDEAGRILPGILGAGTMEMVKDCLSAVLQDEGAIPLHEADSVVEACLRGCSSLKCGPVRPIGDAAGMFRRLRRRGFQIAVNTSDSREATLETLRQLGVTEMVDAVVCGDDDWMIAKPHPVSAYTICARLGVRPEHAIMVGDSPCDVRLGVNAHLGFSIGVLTGIAPRKDLEGDAHIVVQDVTQAVDLILSGPHKHCTPRHVDTPSIDSALLL